MQHQGEGVIDMAARVDRPLDQLGQAQHQRGGRAGQRGLMMVVEDARPQVIADVEEEPIALPRLGRRSLAAFKPLVIIPVFSRTQKVVTSGH